MKLSLICAMAENRVIGINNGLPWHLPGDLKHFKATTMGHSIIMGRNTWESIGRPLPGRHSIVITSDANYLAGGASVVHSIEEAICKAKENSSMEKMKNVVDQTFVIGGGALYMAVLPLAQRFYLTRVHAAVPGDTYLVEFNESEWEEKSRQRYFRDSENPYDFSICLLERKT